MEKIRRFYFYNSRWIFPLCLLVLIFTLFTQLLGLLDKQSNPNITKKSLIDKGHLLELSEWDFSFQNCNFKESPVKCSFLSVEPQTIKFPDLAGTATLLAKKFPEANVAIAKRDFSEDELKWLERFRGKDVSFLIPNSFQSALFLYVGKKEYWATGDSLHAHFSVSVDKLLEHKGLRLEFEFKPLEAFGPADLAPALATPRTSLDYFALRERQIGIGNLVKQIYIGFPLIIAAIALVLDHSKAITLLAAVGAAQSVRSFIAFVVDSGLVSYRHLEILNLTVNGLGAAFLVLLALELAEIRRFTTKAKTCFVIMVAGSALLLRFFGESFLLKTDSVIDAASAAAGLLITCIGFGRYVRQSRKNKETEKSSAGSHTSASLIMLRLAIVATGFGISCLANIEDLSQIKTEAFKNVLDWKHLILFPALISASLLEVGSTSKKMFLFAKEMVSKALIEKELAVGKEVQHRMLPEKKATRAGWSWRSVYLPATALAGDWYDLREIKFANGESVLVACIADVTGHGVGAALATSVISSHWGLWCENLSTKPFPADEQAKEELIRKAPEQINKGLLALRKNENCTAIFCLLDAGAQTVSFCSAGHPGAFVSDGKSLNYLTTSGSRLGVEDPEQKWEAKTSQINLTDFLVLYSDGIVPVGKTISSWASQMKREIRKEKDRGLKEILTAQIKENRRDFRKSKEVEDDITLVAISLAAPKQPQMHHVKTEAANALVS